MRKATLKNVITGEKIKVYATCEHPQCHYGRAVWVDDENIAYLEVDCKVPNPFYKIEEEHGE